jgi:phosphatidate cytidylyltransferase
MICLMQIPAHLELAHLARAKDRHWPVAVTIAGSILLSVTGFVIHRYGAGAEPWFGLVLILSFFTLLLVYYLRHGLSDVLLNCGVGAFALLYLGLLGAYAVRLRCDFGLWAFFMFICAVKFSDVGAYTFGRLYGKHKFAPRLSPGKTWEGLAGAVGTAVLVALFFVWFGGIMPWPWALLFGTTMAVGGQLGDLAESMLKRDAQVKDSSSVIPGFGGVLDILDSPLATAPLAYMFFQVIH